MSSLVLAAISPRLDEVAETISGAPWLAAAHGHVEVLKKHVADERNGNMNSGRGGS